MALEVWTVLYDVKSEGSAAPVGPWATKKMKVINAAGETKEKSVSLPSPVGGPGSVVKSPVAQSAKIVSVEAESAEEAVLAVKKFYGFPSGAGEKTQAEIWETAAIPALAGPKSNTAFTGKQAAGVLTEVTVT